MLTHPATVRASDSENSAQIIWAEELAREGGNSLHQYTNYIMSRVWCIPLCCCQICIRIESLPLNPGGHWEVNAFTWSTHVPSCWHGSLAHSLTFVSHLEPAKSTAELKPQHGDNDYSSCRRWINCNKHLILVELLQLSIILRTWNVHICQQCKPEIHDYTVSTKSKPNVFFTSLLTNSHNIWLYQQSILNNVV